MTRVTYRVELANKIRDGRAVGNLWGVARLIDGCRGGWHLEPQDDESLAYATCRWWNNHISAGNAQ